MVSIQETREEKREGPVKDGRPFSIQHSSIISGVWALGGPDNGLSHFHTLLPGRDRGARERRRGRGVQ